MGYKQNTKTNHISLAEATKYCEYSQEYLSLLARRGLLPAIKLGRNWFIAREDILRYTRKIAIKKGEIQPQSISLAEAAKEFSSSQEYLSLLASKGTISAVKVGRVWFTTREDVEDYFRRVSLGKEETLPTALEEEVSFGRVPGSDTQYLFQQSQLEEEIYSRRPVLRSTLLSVLGLIIVFLNIFVITDGVLAQKGGGFKDGIEKIGITTSKGVKSAIRGSQGLNEFAVLQAGSFAQGLENTNQKASQIFQEQMVKGARKKTTAMIAKVKNTPAKVTSFTEKTDQGARNLVQKLAKSGGDKNVAVYEGVHSLEPEGREAGTNFKKWAEQGALRLKEEIVQRKEEQGQKIEELPQKIDEIKHNLGVELENTQNIDYKGKVAERGADIAENVSKSKENFLEKASSFWASRIANAPQALESAGISLLNTPPLLIENATVLAEQARGKIFALPGAVVGRGESAWSDFVMVKHQLANLPSALQEARARFYERADQKAKTAILGTSVSLNETKEQSQDLIQKTKETAEGKIQNKGKRATLNLGLAWSRASLKFNQGLDSSLSLAGEAADSTLSLLQSSGEQVLGLGDKLRNNYEHTIQGMANLYLVYDQGATQNSYSLLNRPPGPAPGDISLQNQNNNNQKTEEDSSSDSALKEKALSKQDNGLDNNNQTLGEAVLATAVPPSDQITLQYVTTQGASTTQNLTLRGVLFHSGVKIGELAELSRSLDVKERLMVGTLATFQGDIIAHKSLTLGKDLLVQGKSNIEDDLTVGTEDLHVDTDNHRVGINTIHPTQALDVNGNLKVEKALLVVEEAHLFDNLMVDGWTKLTGILEANGGIYIDDDRFVVNGKTGDVETAGTLRVHQDAWFNRNVFIGNGADDLLEVRSRIGSDLVPSINETYNLGSSSLYWKNIYTQSLFTSGNVGAGTANPVARLQVVGDEARIGDGGTVNNATGDGDLYVEDVLEVDGTIFGNIIGVIMPPGFTQGSVVFIDAAGALAEDNANFYWNDASNRLGIGTTSPDTQLEVYGSSNKLRLSYNDTYYADLSTGASGDLTLNPTGGNVLFADNDTIAIGGATGQAYNAIGDTTTAMSHSLASDDDLYIEGDLEVDGAAWFDTGVTVAGVMTAYSVKLYDTNQSNLLNLVWNENDTSNRTLNLLVAGGNRSLTLNENLTIGDGYNITLTALGQDDILTMNESLTIGDGNDGTITFSGASKTLTIEDNSIVNQDVTTDANPTFAGVNADAINIGITAASEIDTDSGNLTLDSASGTVLVDDQLRLALSLYAPTGTFAFGGADTKAYNAIGDTTTAMSHSLASDDDLYIEGDLEVDGAAWFDGSVVLGATTANTLTINAYVNSDIIPNSGGQYDLGTNTRQWRTIYTNSLNASNIFGVIATGSTSSNDWLINSDNTSPDTEDATLTFKRGAPSVNAEIRWDSSESYLSTNVGSFVISPDVGVTAPATAALLINQIHNNPLISANYSGFDRFIVTNLGEIQGADLKLGLNDTSATITTSDTNEDLTINPNGTGDIYFHGTSYQLSDSGDFTLGGRITFENGEYIANETDDLIALVGASGADNTDLYFNLDGAYPILYSNTDTKIGIDDDLEFVGARTISTSAGNLTLNPTGGNVLFADNDTIAIGGATGQAYNAIGDTTTAMSHSLASDDDLYVEGDLEVDGSTYFDGTLTQGGNITIKKADPSLILDVITATDTDFWLGVQDDGAGDDDDLFQIGDGITPGTNPFLTIKTDGNVGIGTTVPAALIHGLSTTEQLRLGYNATNFVSFTVSSTGDVSISPNENTGGLRIFGSTTSPDIVGGYSGNVVDSVGNFIGGGGFSGAINSISNSSTQSGGTGYSSILGGYSNTIDVSGGAVNTITGGFLNRITGTAKEWGNYIGSGYNNVITSAGSTYNNIGRNVIVGGNSNAITITNAAVDDGRAFIGGGGSNSVTANYGVIPGGLSNTVSGAYGFAAGRRAKATATGVFALADSTNADFTVGTADVFGARFSGGYWLTGGNVGIGTTSPVEKLNVIGSAKVQSSAETLLLSEGFENVTFPPTDWTTGGNVGWSRDTAVYNEGLASAASGAIAHSQYSFVQRSYTFPVSGYVKFYWKVSSEDGYDFLSFHIDNDTATSSTGYSAKISGEAGWTEVTTFVTAGTHSLKWIYSKDSAVISGSDKGWIDNVRFYSANSGDIYADRYLFADEALGIGTTDPGKAALAVMSGNVGIGTTSPLAKLDIRGTLSPTTNTSNYGVLTDIDWTPVNGASSIFMYGNRSYAEIPSSHTGTLSGTNLMYGMQGYVGNASSTADLSLMSGGDFQARNTGGADVGYLYGIGIQAQHSGGGTATDIRGITLNSSIFDTAAVTTTATNIYGADIASYIYGYGAGSTATATNIYGARIRTGAAVGSGGSASATNVYNLHLSDIYTSGTVTNKYGLYIADLAGATNIWSIYSVGGKNYFGGNVGIGTTGPLSKLHIVDSAWGGLRLSDNETAATAKYGIITGSQYDSATETEGFALLATNATSGANRISIGGSYASRNAATQIEFWTAANAATRTGTQRMTIDSSGNVGIGDTTGDAKLDILASQTSGILEQISYEGAATLAGSLTGLDLDLSTNVTPSTYNITGLNLELPSGASGDMTFLKLVEGSSTLYDFDVTTAQFNVPTSFNSAGDAAFSYDLIMANPGTAYIKFQGAGYIETESPYGNYDLTLLAANAGAVFVSDVFKVSDSTASTMTLLNQTGSGPILDIQKSGTSRLYIKNDGNVGIGTAAPGSKLHISAPGASGSQTLYIDADNDNLVGDAADSILQLSGDAGINNAQIYFDNGINGLVLKDNNAGGAWFTGTYLGASVSQVVLGDRVGIGGAAGTAKLYVDGNVGIGTAAPTEALTVATAARTKRLLLDSASNGNPIGTGDNTDGVDAIIQAYSGNTAGGNNSQVGSTLALRAGIGTGAGANGDIVFQLASDVVNGGNNVRHGGPAEYMRIKSVTGYVGIGTAAPEALLTVAGVGRFLGSTSANARKISIVPTVAGVQSIYSDYSGSGADSQLILGSYANRANQLVLDTTGNVGIGTVTPGAYKLHVEGPVIGTTWTTGDVFFKATDNGPDVWRMFEDTNSLYTQSLVTGQTVLTIKDTGNIGIGTSTPGTKLAIASLETSASAANMFIDSTTGNVYRSTSSLRYKDDVQTLQDDFTKILQARPTSFIDKATGRRDVGFIAEEFDALGLSNLVIYDEQGRPDAIKYERISLYQNEVLKEQQQKLSVMDSDLQLVKNDLGLGASDSTLPSSGFSTSRLTGLESGIGNQESGILSLESRIQSQESRIQDLETRITNYELRITENDADTAPAQTVEGASSEQVDLVSLQSTLQTLVDSLSNLENVSNQLNTLSASILTVMESNQANTARIDELEKETQDLQQIVKIVEDKVIIGEVNKYLVLDAATGLEINGENFAVDKDGNVKVKGELKLVSGRIASETGILELNPGEASDTVPEPKVVVKGKEMIVEGDLKVGGKIIAGASDTQAAENKSIITSKGVIKAGEKEAIIETEAVSEDSFIGVTPLSAASLYVSEIRSEADSETSKQGFTVSALEPAKEDIQFNWWVIIDKIQEP